MIIKCDDCNGIGTIMLATYGNSYMAEFNCADCDNYYYDTNLSEEEINGLKTQDYCGDCGQVEWLCICEPQCECEGDGCTKCTTFCGDCLTPLNDCGCKP
jgi:hypothetical protein